MSNIYKAFKNKKAFIGFLTAGDPSEEKTVEYILEMERAGADLICCIIDGSYRCKKWN